MTTLSQTKPLTAKIKEVLEAANLLVGQAQAPDGGGWQEDGSFNNYVVIYSIPTSGSGGVLGDPQADVQLVYQITCVGESDEDAKWVVDKVIPAMLAANLSVTGRKVALVKLEMSPGIRRDDDMQPPLFLATPRFRLWTTPS